MRWLLLATLTVLATTCSFGQASTSTGTSSQTNKSGQKKPPTSSSAHTTVAGKLASQHSAHASAHIAPVSGSASQVSSSRTVHGRRISTRRRAAPGPTYQLHPDTERYQQIQQALADKGYFKGEVNGTWGDDSVDALKRFQADQKLPDDGKINALTLTGLGLGPKHDAGTTSSMAPAAVSAPVSNPPPGAPLSTTGSPSQAPPGPPK